MHYGLLKSAIRVLNPIWRTTCLRVSLAWGPKKADNPYSGNNIVMMVGKEMVVVSWPKTQHKSLIIHQFRESADTTLGERVKKTLDRAGLTCVLAAAKPAKTLEIITQEVISQNADGFWYCPICKEYGIIDFSYYSSEHEAAIKNAYQEHKEVALADCCEKKPKIYQLIDGRMTELSELTLITSAQRSH